MSICILYKNVSVGEYPVGGENMHESVSSCSSELVGKEDTRSSGVVYYGMCGMLGFPLTNFSV